jgi:hypothetical protein
MMIDGKRTAAYDKVRAELEPIEGRLAKVPKAFTKDEWALLSYEDKQDFVNKKKEAVLSGLRSRLSSPVVSLIVDLQDLEVRMAGQESKDVAEGETLSVNYLKALSMKVELAKAIKALMDKGVIKHEHVVKHISDEDFVDVNFEEVITGAKEATVVGEENERKD